MVKTRSSKLEEASQDQAEVPATPSPTRTEAFASPEAPPRAPHNTPRSDTDSKSSSNYQSPSESLSSGLGSSVNIAPSNAYNDEVHPVNMNSNTFDIDTLAEATQLLQLHFEESQDQHTSLYLAIMGKTSAILNELKGMGMFTGEGGQVVLNMISKHVEAVAFNVNTFLSQEATRTKAFCENFHAIYKNQNDVMVLALARAQQNVQAAPRGALLAQGGIASLDGYGMSFQGAEPFDGPGNTNNLQDPIGHEDVNSGLSQREQKVAAKAANAKVRQDAETALVNYIDELSMRQAGRPKQLFLSEVGQKNFVVAYPQKATKTEAVEYYVLDCLVCNRVFENAQSMYAHINQGGASHGRLLQLICEQPKKFAGAVQACGIKVIDGTAENAEAHNKSIREIRTLEIEESNKKRRFA